MTPEEWQKGMENEAASVEDQGWEQDTKRAVRFLRWRSRLPELGLALGSATAFSALGVILGVLGSRVGVHVDQNPVGTFIRVYTPLYLTALLALVFLLGVGLGRARVAPRLAALAFLLLPVLDLILGALITAPTTVEFDTFYGVMPPMTIDLAVVQPNLWMIPEAVFSAAFALLGATLGQRWVRRCANRLR